MDKKEFMNFCKEDLKKRGFKKIKKGYYFDGGNGISIIIYPQGGSFGKYYYINCGFSMCSLNDFLPRPIFDDMDFTNRIAIMSRGDDTIDGKHYMTAQIDYEEYDQSELQPFFDDFFEKWVNPVITKGKKYILENKDEYHLGGKHVTEKKVDVLENLKKNNKVF